MRILYAALGGFAMDLLLGDPAWLTPLHPVVLMGKESALWKNACARFSPKPAGVKRPPEPCWRCS